MFCQRGPTLTLFFILFLDDVLFLVDEGRREDPDTTKWLFADGPIMAQHCMLACSFVIFQGI